MGLSEGRDALRAKGSKPHLRILTQFPVEPIGADGYPSFVHWELPFSVVLVVGGVAALIVQQSAEAPPRVVSVVEQMRCTESASGSGVRTPALKPRAGFGLAQIEQLLESGTPGERAQAATILATTPMPEADLLPLLLRLGSDPSARVRRHAARALLIVAHLSSEGIARLVALLDDPDEAVRSLAATGLARSEVRAHPRAVDALLLAARDPIQDVRWAVLESLASHFGGRPEPILHAWVRGLRDPCDDVKSIAANCIEGVGPAARSAAAAIETAMLSARDPWLEWELSDALNAATGR